MNASKKESYRNDAEIGLIRIKQRMAREHAARNFAREQFEREARIFDLLVFLGSASLVLFGILYAL